MPDLFLVPQPIITIATNTFERVPIIVEYDGVPLIEMIQAPSAGFTTRFAIFHPDGTKLAITEGSRLFLTDSGEKSGLTLEHPNHMTVCKLGGQILFEISRTEAAALKTEAELYTPDGRFIRCNNNLDAGLPSGLFNGEDQLQLGSIIMRGCHFSGCRKGIVFRSDGSVGMGAN